jgi:hypothetical protein
MLLTPFSKAPTTNGQAPATKTVTGQYLAKATVNYPPWRRAEDAARWLRGELTIKPTVKLAAKTFGVSVPWVASARELLEQRGRAKRHGTASSLMSLSDDAVERIVVEIGPERILGVVDKLTQPSLPLAAAE